LDELVHIRARERPSVLSCHGRASPYATIATCPCVLSVQQSLILIDSRPVARKESKKQADRQLERERMHRRYDLMKWTVAPVVWIASTWLPLKALAGHKTSLTITFTITIAISIIASASLIVMYIRARRAEAEIQRLEITITEIEGAKKELKAA
jgi:hypothetical protein